MANTFRVPVTATLIIKQKAPDTYISQNLILSTLSQPLEQLPFSNVDWRISDKRKSTPEFNTQNILLSQYSSPGMPLATYIWELPLRTLVSQSAPVPNLLTSLFGVQEQMPFRLTDWPVTLSRVKYGDTSIVQNLLVATLGSGVLPPPNKVFYVINSKDHNRIAIEIGKTILHLG